MKKADFANLLQGVRELKAARRGALPAGSVRDHRLAGSLAAVSNNVANRDRNSARARNTASQKTQRAP